MCSFFEIVEDNSIYPIIRDEIRGLDIGVVINNVGMSYEYPESFDKVEDNEKFLTQMIRCNVDSVANITQMVLPGEFHLFLATSFVFFIIILDMIKKHRGLIINVSSISGRRPTPLLALYSGTKGFIDLFSRFVRTNDEFLFDRLLFNLDHWLLNVHHVVCWFNLSVLVMSLVNCPAFAKLR